VKIITWILETILTLITIIKLVPMKKKGFWKTAYLILTFLVENWEIIYEPLKELIDEIKEQKKGIPM
jgi:hypothetical protein